MTWNQEIYVKAWNFASLAHQGQQDPGTKNPYINHIGLVAMEAAATVSNSENIDNPDLLIQCALLHDTIEDTELEYGDIEYEFGREIADGVLALTKDKKLKTKVEKMSDSLSRIKQQPEEVWMVKLCDRITNLQPPPLHWDKDKIQAYYYESISILESLESASDFLKERLQEKIDNYKYFLGQFEVFVYDNWDIYDESESYTHSKHETFEAAVECCKKIVDDDLEYMLKEHGIDKLYGIYCLGGESPSIRPTPDGKEFSAGVYAEERCNQIEKELNEKQSSG